MDELQELGDSELEAFDAIRQEAQRLMHQAFEELDYIDGELLEEFMARHEDAEFSVSTKRAVWIASKGLGESMSLQDED